MSQPDWNRLSRQVDRTYRKDAGRGEVRLRGQSIANGTQEPPKPTTRLQTPQVPVSSPVGRVGEATEAPDERVHLLGQWRATIERINKADRWFAEHREATDPERYRNNEDRYCNIMAASIEIAERLSAIGVTVAEAAA